MKQWYLLRCKSREEKRAAENLERQGYESFYPMIRLFRRRRGKKNVIIEPMFPGYLFVHLDTQAENWGPIRSTRGVTDFVRFGALPSIVDSQIVSELRTKDESEGFIDSEKKNEVFVQGERVVIAEGCFKGLEGVYESACGLERSVILLDIVSACQKLKIDNTFLDKASAFQQ